jgi:two-component system, NtrC family, nitrogen regulation sensor histidine kinase NtrY
LFTSRPFWIIVLSLLTTGFLAFYQYESRQENYVQRVSDNIKTATQTQETEVQQVRRLYKPGAIPVFVQFPRQTIYPYFVFENRQLVFWSDARWVPGYEILAGNFQYRFLNLRGGKYVVHRQEWPLSGRQIEVFSVIPLYFKFEIENNYLTARWNTALIPDHFGVKLNGELNRTRPNIFAADGSFLFSLELAQPAYYHPLTLPVLFGFCLLLFSGVWVYQVLQDFRQAHRHEAGAGLLLVYLLVLRWYMVEFSLPYNLNEIALFDSKSYASSALAPSLGDFLLNYVCGFLWLVYLMRYFLDFRLYRRLLRLRASYKTGISLGLILIAHQMLYLPFSVIRNVYWHSPIRLDSTETLDFSAFQQICWLIFLLASAVYFMSLHLIGFVLGQFFSDHRMLFLVGLGGTAAFATVGTVVGEIDYNLLIFNVLYLLLLFIFRFPSALYRFQYITSLYLFAAALTCAATGAYTIGLMEENRRQMFRQKFGEEILRKKDVEGEFLLSQAINSIQQDNFIQIKLAGILPPVTSLERQVRHHLNSYFERYTIDIFLFNALGEALLPDDIGETYADFEKKFRLSAMQTIYPDLYLVSKFTPDPLSRHYAAFIPIRREGGSAGFVLLELRQKSTEINKVYPELLVDVQTRLSPASRRYDYAVFRGNKLLQQWGNFNYAKDFPAAWFNLPGVWQKGISANGMHHQIVKNPAGEEVAVISSPDRGAYRLFSNLSFLFLLLSLAVIGIIIFYNLSAGAGVNTSFSAKIQLYLNLAFFLPLLVVSVVMLNRFNLANLENLQADFLKKARNVSYNLQETLISFYAGNMEEEQLAGELNRLARYAEADINLFDRNGRLLTSSQPLIYEKNILSRYLSPGVVVAVGQERESEILLSESVGNLRYRSVYSGIRNRKGELLGIVSLPFFESQAESERQVRGLLATVINVFTAVFIIFLLLSYFASRVLTVPLRLLTEKFRRTSLQKVNEPLSWQSDDEIGWLVGEYNKMLLNLEENKQALARQEKESAWREMAQQVAHEIKNPLTPMKLTLQHLQRTLSNGSPETPLQKSLKTLMEQVETLNDIATSFSSFAKMPTPKEETADMAQIVRQTLALYTNHPGLTLTTDIADENYWVKTDVSLMSRILTNLILNGLQSVPAYRKAELRVSLKKQQNQMLLEVRDNGSGIPAAVQPRIFQPNFSTKYAGSGIGLAVAKQGIEHFGGHIWFETIEGEGTSFFITLPIGI